MPTRSLSDRYDENKTDIVLNKEQNCLAVILTKDKSTDDRNNCEGVAIIDFGSEQKTLLEVEAVKQILIQLVRNFRDEEKSRKQIESISS